MTNESIAFAPITAAVAAAGQLDELMARVGVDGLAAAFAEPALLARIDQHAAAVRESLTDAGRAVDVDGLAAYARSITAGLVRAGRPVPAVGAAPQSPAGWLTADWSLLRLVSVCLLAVEGDLD